MPLEKIWFKRYSNNLIIIVRIFATALITNNHTQKLAEPHFWCEINVMLPPYNFVRPPYLSLYLSVIPYVHIYLLLPLCGTGPGVKLHRVFGSIFARIIWYCYTFFATHVLLQLKNKSSTYATQFSDTDTPLHCNLLFFVILCDIHDINNCLRPQLFWFGSFLVLSLMRSLERVTLNVD